MAELGIAARISTQPSAALSKTIGYDDNLGHSKHASCENKVFRVVSVV